MQAFLLGGLMVTGCQTASLPPIVKVSASELRREIPAALAVRRSRVPASRNGWFVAVPSKSGAKGFSEELNVATGALWDRATVLKARSAVKDAAPLLARLRRGVELPAWQLPIYDPLLGFPDLARCKTLAKIAVLRARLEMEDGQPEAAVADLLLVHRLADRVRMAEGTSGIVYFVAVAIGEIGNRALILAANHPNISRSALETALKGVPEPHRTDPGLAKALRYELSESFVPLIASVEGSAETSDEERAIVAGHPHRFDAREMVRLYARGLANDIANTNRSWSEQRSNAALIADLRRGWPRSFFVDGTTPTASEIQRARPVLRTIPNALGRKMVSEALSVFEGSTTVSFRSRASAAAARLAILLALKSKGVLGLPTVPRDPFSNGPMRYDPKRRLIWSVGPDGRDQNGAGVGYNSPKDPDLRFALDWKPR